MDSKESNVVCIYNEKGKNIKELLKDVLNDLICEDIDEKVRIYETNII